MQQRIIVAGSRELTNKYLVYRFLDRYKHWFGVMVNGRCKKGVDEYAYRWALQNNIVVDPYPAKWRVNGVLNKRAGFERNQAMSENADGLILIWDGSSPGSQDMLERAQKQGLWTIVYLYLQNKIIASKGISSGTII